MKISLEVLKARSEHCLEDVFYYEEIFTLARKSKSPTDVYELAKDKLKKTFCLGKKPSEKYAKGFRYLAIIKRDYGVEVFDSVVNEAKGKKSALVEYHLFIKALIQTSSRLYYLYNNMSVLKSAVFTFDPIDMGYVDIVEDVVARCKKLDPKRKEELFKFSRGDYLNDAWRFVYRARNQQRRASRDGLEKAARTVAGFARLRSAELRIPEIAVSVWCDSVHELSKEIRRAKGEIG